MSIIKYQKGQKFTPSPNWKNPTQQPLSQINPDTKSQTERQTNRRLQEGADAQKQIVDQQMTFNNIINGQIDLNPNAMLYSRPTQSQRNAEVQTQNKSTGLQNFARVTQPTINKTMQAEAIPLVQKQGKNIMNQFQRKLDNYIPQSIDKLIKPKYNLENLKTTRFKVENYLDDGAESVVYKEGDNVSKVRKQNEDIPTLKKELRRLDRAEATPLNISGYYKDGNGELVPILKQPYIRGTRPEYPEIQQHMQSQGWKADQDVFRKGNKVQYDIHPGNFIKDYYNKIHPIDIHIQSKREFAKYQSQIPSLQLRSWRQGGLIKYKNGTN